MEFQRPLCLFFVLFSLLTSSQAYKFNVGGSKGWVPNPSESYTQWAGRNRFQINDILVFKYNKGSDSVLEVNKDGYDKCNKTNPIKKFEEGDTEFKLDRSGPFYFISGKDDNCEKGEKLLLVVLTPRGQTRTPPPPHSVPSPTSPPPSTSPSPSISPPPSPTGGGVAPISPSPKPSPPSESPTVSPTTSPSPSVSPSPAGNPPSVSPSPVSTTPATSPVPAGGPTVSPPAPATTSPSPSPVTNSPAGGPPAPSPMTGTSPPSASPSGSGPTTSPPSASPASSNDTAPPPANKGSSAWAVAPSSFLVYSVAIVVGAVLLR